MYQKFETYQLMTKIKKQINHLQFFLFLLNNKFFRICLH